MGEQVKLSETERESLREASPSLGARRASCRREPLSVPPTSVSSDHLLVFPGTLPNPGTCPCPACLSPLLLPALAQGCELVWPPSFCCCHVEGQTLQAGTRFAGVRCRMAMGQPGLVARRQWGEEILPTPLPGVHATACELVCAPLPSLHASLPCSGTPAGSWLLHVLSAGLA